MEALKQVESDLWSNEDGSQVISLEDGRYYVRDEDGEQANYGSLKKAMAFATLLWDDDED